MSKIGDRIAHLRKVKGISQTDLAKQINASREAIGKYERNEAMPSVETAKKIADVFEVTLDFLVDENAQAAFDKQTVKRLKDIEVLNPLGLLFIEEMDYVTAIKYFRVSSLFNRAYASMEIGHYKEALADLKHALKISPDNPYANNYMGYYLYKQGKKLEACKYFKIALSNGVNPLINDIKYCE